MKVAMQDLCALARRLSSWGDQGERASAGRRCQDAFFPRLGIFCATARGSPSWQSWKARGGMASSQTPQARGNRREAMGDRIW